MRTVRFVRHDTGTDVALNPDNVVMVGGLAVHETPIVGASLVMVLGGPPIALAGNPGAVDRALGPEFVAAVDGVTMYLNRRHVVAIEPSRDQEGRTVIGSCDVQLSAGGLRLTFPTRLGDIAARLEAGAAQPVLVIQ